MTELIPENVCIAFPVIPNTPAKNLGRPFQHDDFKNIWEYIFTKTVKELNPETLNQLLATQLDMIDRLESVAYSYASYYIKRDAFMSRVAKEEPEPSGSALAQYYEKYIQDYQFSKYPKGEQQFQLPYDASDPRLFDLQNLHTFHFANAWTKESALKYFYDKLGLSARQEPPSSRPITQSHMYNTAARYGTVVGPTIEGVRGEPFELEDPVTIIVLFHNKTYQGHVFVWESMPGNATQVMLKFGGLQTRLDLTLGDDTYFRTEDFLLETVRFYALANDCAMLGTLNPDMSKAVDFYVPRRFYFVNPDEKVTYSPVNGFDILNPLDNFKPYSAEGLETALKMDPYYNKDETEFANFDPDEPANLPILKHKIMIRDPLFVLKDGTPAFGVKNNPAFKCFIIGSEERSRIWPEESESQPETAAKDVEMTEAASPVPVVTAGIQPNVFVGPTAILAQPPKPAAVQEPPKKKIAIVKQKKIQPLKQSTPIAVVGQPILVPQPAAASSAKAVEKAPAVPKPVPIPRLADTAYVVFDLDPNYVSENVGSKIMWTKNDFKTIWEPLYSKPWANMTNDDLNEIWSQQYDMLEMVRSAWVNRMSTDVKYQTGANLEKVKPDPTQYTEIEKMHSKDINSTEFELPYTYKKEDDKVLSVETYEYLTKQQQALAKKNFYSRLGGLIKFDTNQMDFKKKVEEQMKKMEEKGPDNEFKIDERANGGIIMTQSMFESGDKRRDVYDPIQVIVFLHNREYFGHVYVWKTTGKGKKAAGLFKFCGLQDRPDNYLIPNNHADKVFNIEHHLLEAVRMYASYKGGKMLGCWKPALRTLQIMKSLKPDGFYMISKKEQMVNLQINDKIKDVTAEKLAKAYNADPFKEQEKDEFVSIRTPEVKMPLWKYEMPAKQVSFLPDIELPVEMWQMHILTEAQKKTKKAVPRAPKSKAESEKQSKKQEPEKKKQKREGFSSTMRSQIQNVMSKKEVQQIKKKLAEAKQKVTKQPKPAEQSTFGAFIAPDVSAVQSYQLAGTTVQTPIDIDESMPAAPPDEPMVPFVLPVFSSTVKTTEPDPYYLQASIEAQKEELKAEIPVEYQENYVKQFEAGNMAVVFPVISHMKPTKTKGFTIDDYESIWSDLLNDLTAKTDVELNIAFATQIEMLKQTRDAMNLYVDASMLKLDAANDSILTNLHELYYKSWMSPSSFSFPLRLSKDESSKKIIAEEIIEIEDIDQDEKKAIWGRIKAELGRLPPMTEEEKEKDMKLNGYSGAYEMNEKAMTGQLAGDSIFKPEETGMDKYPLAKRYHNLYAIVLFYGRKYVGHCFFWKSNIAQPGEEAKALQPVQVGSFLNPAQVMKDIEIKMEPGLYYAASGLQMRPDYVCFELKPRENKFDQQISRLQKVASENKPYMTGKWSSFIDRTQISKEYQTDTEGEEVQPQTKPSYASTESKIQDTLYYQLISVLQNVVKEKKAYMLGIFDPHPQLRRGLQRRHFFLFDRDEEIEIQGGGRIVVKKPAGASWEGDKAYMKDPYWRHTQDEFYSSHTVKPNGKHPLIWKQLVENKADNYLLPENLWYPMFWRQNSVLGK